MQIVSPWCGGLASTISVRDWLVVPSLNFAFMRYAITISGETVSLWRSPRRRHLFLASCLPAMFDFGRECAPDAETRHRRHKGSHEPVAERGGSHLGGLQIASARHARLHGPDDPQGAPGAAGSPEMASGRCL
jgi:hypothetical protein